MNSTKTLNCGKAHSGSRVRTCMINKNNEPEWGFLSDECHISVIVIVAIVIVSTLIGIFLLALLTFGLSKWNERLLGEKNGIKKSKSKKGKTGATTTTATATTTLATTGTTATPIRMRSKNVTALPLNNVTDPSDSNENYTDRTERTERTERTFNTVSTVTSNADSEETI